MTSATGGIEISVEESGATRSSDGAHLDFTSMPWLGIFGVAATSCEGGTKYGRFNYAKGMSAWKLVNRALRHIGLWLLGDRSEPNLEHAAWGLLLAIQEMTLRGEENAKHLLGPGATISPEMLAFMAEEAPRLADFRETEEAKKLGHWSTAEMPEVATILAQRKGEKPKEEVAKVRSEMEALADLVVKSMEEPAKEIPPRAAQKRSFRSLNPDHMGGCPPLP